ncbi:hypothetical protein Hanom_Chr12g01087211 [Helianthus anomalus]
MNQYAYGKPFTDLKSLKIYPADVIEPEVTMYTEKNYLQGGSQGATFTLVSYEVLLYQWKENSEAKMAHIEQISHQQRATWQWHATSDDL